MSPWKLSLPIRKRRDWVALIPGETQKSADLTQLAKKLAVEYQQIFPRNNCPTKETVDRFRDNSRLISSKLNRLSRQKRSQSLTATEKWLSENKTIILETAQNVSLTLTAQLLSRLPNLKSPHAKIRILEIIINLISHSDHHLSYNRLKKFILDYQAVTPLTIAELWALPMIVQAVLLDSIADILSRNLEDESIVKNIILGLRNIHKINWNDFVEEFSTMEKILRRDPAGVYPLMDFRTRDIYRHNIEEIHFQTGHDENELASWIVNQARKFQPNHIGHYILGPGRAQVERIFIPKRKLLDNLSLLLRHRPVKIYFLTLWGTTLLFFYLFSILAIPQLLWLLTIFPSFYISNLFTHLIMVRLYHPSYLPKMNPELPVAPKDRTIILVPTILSSDPQDRAGLLSKLEENFSNNRDPNIFFAMALAWPETARQDGQPTPQEQQALVGFKKDLGLLNHKYPHPQNYFHLFFRDRLWNPGQQSFVEWERKRGKVMEFVRLLRGATDTSFNFSSAKPGFLATIKYVITLDDDITIPRDAAKKLIATISHPLNLPVIDPKRQIVTAGYGIIQPRISTQIPQMAKTFADYIFSGDSGWDSYSTIASSLYQDVFRESFFLGRGIFDVAVFDQILRHRFPENTLLSHDHLEGFYCRTGFASDIQIFETYPQSYFSFSSRLHRWVRGDWQRFFWLFPQVKNQAGQTVKNPLHLFQRWKLADDMIQNLVLPASLLLCLALMFFPPQNQILGLGFFLIITLTSPLVSFLQSLPIQKNLLRAWHHYFIIILENFRTFLAKFFFNLIFALHQSLTICHAIATALTRTLITKKKRLEWAIFLQTNTKNNDNLLANFRQTLPLELALLALLFFSWFSLSPFQKIIPFTLCLLWLGAPLMIYLLNRPSAPSPVFSPDQQTHLRIIAWKTWRFFDDLVGPSTHFLPPDHFQQTTSSPVSTRTSATDIGLYLTSIVSAFDLGFISMPEFLNRCSKTLDTMTSLETLSGHFFNWYDVKSLKPMPPGYISTVDSGNLACSLLTLSQALRDLPGTVAQQKKGHRLASLAKSLAMKMDFSFLYDPKQNLFRIGYSLYRHSFDLGHYDLLASEVRLTSLFAIAKHDVPLKHWSALSRPLALYRSRAALLSWGGSIFEYLLPNLFLPSFSQTLLWETCQTIIRGHIDYGMANKIPWGISESSYGLVNKDGHYRYKLHGVPDFGLKQFPTKDLVISPYSVFLAMEFVPQKAYKNILRLEAQGLSGKYGLYEAIDYTNYEPGPLPDPIIRTYLCHHQGAILGAITNQLVDFSLRRRFCAIEPVRSHLTLLQEKIPVQVSFTVPQTPPETDISEEPVAAPDSPVAQTHSGPSTLTPKFNLLSNGRYKIFGYSAYKDIQLTRSGQAIFLRDLSTQKVWPAASRHNWEIETSLETAIPHNDDVEIRLLRLTNHSSKKRQLELTFNCEIVLNSADSDQSHPAFSKMRLASELVENPSPVLLFRRFTPPGTESLLLACHLFSDALFSKIIVETARRSEITAPVSANHVPKYSLDPVACFQTKITLEPKATAQLCFLQTVAVSQTTALENIAKYRSFDLVRETLDQAQTRGVPELFMPLHRATAEELLTCLFLGKGILSKNLVQPDIAEIDWNLPAVTILIAPSTHPSFLHASLNLCYFLAYQGFSFKVIIIAFDRDNYYQNTFNSVHDTVSNFETLVVNNNLVSPSITTLRSYNLSPMAIRFITSTSSVILDGNKKSSAAVQINLAFKKIL